MTGESSSLLSSAPAVPTASMPAAGVSLASAYRAALEWADDAGQAVAD